MTRQLARTAALALLFKLVAAAAQSPAPPTMMETVEVTGTRIPRDDPWTPTPVLSLDALAIRRSGTSNLGEWLNQLPQLGSTFSLGNSISPFGTGGLNLLDLRRLGTERTLVLVDGLRHVGGAAGSTAVDINSIPLEWVERIDIITGGASAAYGADAIGGVINFVLKRDYQGLDLRLQRGHADDSGFGSSLASISAGSNFGDGRGNAAVSLAFSQQDRLRAKQRASTSRQYRVLANPANGGAGDGIADRIQVADAGLFALGTGGVIFGPDGGLFTFDPDGRFRPLRLDGIVDPSLQCSDCDFLDTASVRDLQPRFDRHSLNARIGWQAAPQLRLNAQASYAHSDTRYYTQPAFDFFSGHLLAQRDNPFLPTGLAEYMDQQGITAIEINRFNTDAGQRGEDNGRDTLRLVLSADGALDGQWTYRIAGVYGRSTVKQIGLNNRINDRFYAATDVVTDPATGRAACRIAVDATASLPDGRAMPADIADDATNCIPANIFGAGAIDPTSQAFYNRRIVGRSTVSQSIFSAHLANAALLELPAGPLGFAGGVEYRLERSDYRPDPLLALGTSFLPAIPAERGHYDATEAFAEISVPLLTDRPGVHYLQLDLAGRVSDYSTVGNTHAWDIGLDYRPLAALRLRGSYAEAIRAPNITELYSPRFSSLFRLEDPCSQSALGNSADPALRLAQCEAQGRPQGFEASADDGLISGTLGGNPQLHEETARTATAGWALMPPQLPGLVLSMDWWHIRIDDAIVLTGAQDILNGCVDSAASDNAFCGLIQRDPQSFELSSIEQTVQNLQAIETSGIDYAGRYTFAVASGRVDLDLIATRLIKLHRYPFQQDRHRHDEEVGELGDPQWLGNFSVGYTQGGASLYWKVRYIGPQLLLEREVLAANPERQSPSRIGAYVYHHLQLRYDRHDGIGLYMGADNLFQKDLPPGLYGDGDSAILDNIGRYYYAGIDFRF